jgi:hypothetical protein
LSISVFEGGDGQGGLLLNSSNDHNSDKIKDNKYSTYSLQTVPASAIVENNAEECDDYYNRCNE